MNITKGNLIKLALTGQFDIIAHGCNCMSKQKSGIAKQMVESFGTDKYPMEVCWKGPNINKLGCIDAQEVKVKVGEADKGFFAFNLTVVNCYTQYRPGKPGPGYVIPFDYDAFRMCMRKINYIYEDMSIGLPMIGCGLAEANWNKVQEIIEEELTLMDVTIVEYEKD